MQISFEQLNNEDIFMSLKDHLIRRVSQTSMIINIQIQINMDDKRPVSLAVHAISFSKKDISLAEHVKKKRIKSCH